jgi:hypothetical protein
VERRNQVIKIHAPTSPGRGMDAPDCGLPGATRLKTRSIPNVSTARLIRRVAVLHDMFHAPDGLHAFDGPRMNMIENGVKIVGIRNELRVRGIVLGTGCRFCDGR